MNNNYDDLLYIRDYIDAIIKEFEFNNDIVKSYVHLKNISRSISNYLKANGLGDKNE